MSVGSRLSMADSNLLLVPAQSIPARRCSACTSAVSFAARARHSCTERSLAARHGADGRRCTTAWSKI